MEEIYEPNASFNFDQLVLSPPSSILGGNYFIKYSILGNPLYIQSPKCCTKTGIAKAGKKLYCDLMMSNDHENFIQWLENLETYSQECIYNNRAKWFETELEKHDIENSFASPVKTYKSGKFYITRTNVPTSLGKCSLKIYDENENPVDIEQIKDTTNIITILEIQGIKCSARSFQIEIELKQMMVLKPSKLFEKCIIKSQTNRMVSPQIVSPQNVSPNSSSSINSSIILDNPNHLGEIALTTFVSEDLDETLEQENNQDDQELDRDDQELDQSDQEEQDTIFKTRKSVEPLSLVKSIEPQSLVKSNESIINQDDSPILANPFEMTEIEFNLDELPENETIQIKKRNDVYYQMYREAKKKAKLARDLALSTYLDAKRIKNTYMLDEIDDDSDLDQDEMKFQDET